ncbi:hypothetical protein BD31_I0559 [Candidatus Nitrosopumilus salaria BD31]|jgi:hypothetical protein|uniref:Uncharacterized protein n=1 Tax=Candidatus Nitrosopumilus salarius BD31 TaxID=859350 RepID=I3D2Y0_9ARCH|nr:hypothetical protein [Candidatus Nitrosopumilus salaria]EIJ66073.1 hypothetical protein BD31_I0559 [Candidatus Nitrosopumilus salaria BD31]
MANQTLIRGGILLIFFGGLTILIGGLSEMLADYLSVTIRLLHLLLWIAIFVGITLILVGAKSKGRQY